MTVTVINLNNILVLNKTATKLHYLKLWFNISNIPDFVWTFDWDSLPWRTGFIFLFYQAPGNFTRKFKLVSENKTESPTIPPVHFFYGYGVIKQIGNKHIDRHPLHEYLDFSYNRLESLGYFQATLISNMKLKLNFSHNNLQEVDFKDRFHSTVIFNVQPTEKQTKNNFSPKMLDLSYNQLDDPRVDTYHHYYTIGGSDFLLLPHLQELYLQHNNFTRLPQYADYLNGVVANNRNTIKDFKELRILDMSYNYITEIDPDDLIADDFSPLLLISFKNNSLSNLPSSVYKARYLTHADFSNNRISFSSIWPQNIQWTKRTKRQTSIYLSGNFISNLNLAELNQSQINDLHNVLEDFDIHLDGNPLKCACKTHRMFQYLVSASQSERANEDIENLPDFSFYESYWKCTSPPMWVEIPIMQIPEYQYNTMCNPLKKCSDNCLCYHSWKLHDVIVANCSYNIEHALSTFPEELPDLTTQLYMSQSNIQSVCSVQTYFKNLHVLDLSLNKVEEICPQFLSCLGNVRKLNLTRNQLKQLPTEIELMTNLTELDLSNNMLVELPKSVQNMANLKVIDISGNKFRCDCGTFWMTEWLVNSLAVKVEVEDSYSLVCVSGQGQGKHLINLNKYDVGCNDPLIHGLIGLSVTFTLTIILATVIYKYKGYIKVWLYARFGFHPWDNVKENHEEKDYDAFVSFCHKDADWVLNTLLPYLEAPQCGFHLCVHDRDFVPGATINKNITTAIKFSRRTILVLTPDFIKSGWCDFEFQVAHKRAIDDRSNFLIVVVMKEVDEKKLNETLRFYMKTSTYVSVNDKWFWQKMLYAMPKVPIDKLKAQQNNQPENWTDGNNRNDINKWNDRNNINPDDYNVPLLIDVVHDDQEEAEHHPDKNQLEAMVGNGAAVQCNDHIIDVSSSDDDVTTDSNHDKFEKDKVYQHPPFHSNHKAVDNLPPLFKRINTYYDVQ